MLGILTPALAPLPATVKQKMILTDSVKELLGQILRANLSSMHMVLIAAGACGKGEALN